MKSKKILTIIVVVLCVSALAAFIIYDALSSDKTPYTKNGFAMGTVITESIYSDDENAAEAASAEILTGTSSLENNYISWRVKGSDVCNINSDAGNEVKVSSLTYSWLKQITGVCKDTNGVFDITIGELSSLWGIGTDNAKVPTDEEIQTALYTIDYTRISFLKDNKISIGEGQMLDIGAVGKGIACDEAKKILKKYDKIDGAVISVGGSLLIYGENPNSDDKSFTVGIRDPKGSENDYCMTVSVKDCCISTSGDYEKVLVNNGKTYHHILNPYTGYPAETDVTGVTVFCDSGLLSDALSTSCFILGCSKESLELLAKYDAEAVFICKDNSVYATDGIRDKLTLTNSDLSLKTDI